MLTETLQQRNIKLLMLDFDNTIVPYTTNTPTEEMERWLKAMTSGEVPVCVVSNSKKDRVKRFCSHYGIDCITHAKKPFTKGIRECLDKYGVAPHEAALVGDQIFTDVLGGKLFGAKVFLTEPLGPETDFFIKIKRKFEKFIR